MFTILETVLLLIFLFWLGSLVIIHVTSRRPSSIYRDSIGKIITIFHSHPLLWYLGLFAIIFFLFSIKSILFPAIFFLGTILFAIHYFLSVFYPSKSESRHSRPQISQAEMVPVPDDKPYPNERISVFGCFFRTVSY